jgi:hypothetical protein
MSATRTQRQRAKHVELLQKQQADLLKMADRHWQWMKDADDIETRRVYRGIANLIRKSAEWYDSLLDTLQKKHDKR